MLVKILYHCSYFTLMFIEKMFGINRSLSRYNKKNTPNPNSLNCSEFYASNTHLTQHFYSAIDKYFNTCICHQLFLFSNLQQK